MLGPKPRVLPLDDGPKIKYIVDEDTGIFYNSIIWNLHPSIDEFKDIFKLLADSKYVIMSSTSSSLGIIEKIVEPVPVKEWLSIPDEVIIYWNYIKLRIKF